MTCQWQWTYTRVILSYISHIAAIDVLYMKHGSLSRATKQQYTYEIGCSGTWLQEHTNNNNNKSMWVGWYATTSMHTNAYIAYIRIHRCAQFPKVSPQCTRSLAAHIQVHECRNSGLVHSVDRVNKKKWSQFAYKHAYMYNIFTHFTVMPSTWFCADRLRKEKKIRKGKHILILSTLTMKPVRHSPIFAQAPIRYSSISRHSRRRRSNRRKLFTCTQNIRRERLGERWRCDFQAKPKVNRLRATASGQTKMVTNIFPFNVTIGWVNSAWN